MATLTMTLREATGFDLAGGGKGFLWDVIAIAAARSFTLNIGDTIQTEILDLVAMVPGPVEEVVGIKKMNTNNADVFRAIGGADASLTLWQYLPLHRAASGGNQICYTATATNHTGWRGTPAPYIQLLCDIATGVPTTFNLWLHCPTRSV